MRRTTVRRLLAVAGTALVPTTLPAQAQPAANVNTFAPSGARAEALSHFTAGAEASALLSTPRAAEHLRAALAADSTFGLARSLLANITGGAPSQRDHARATIDAARGSAGEVMMALAYRENAAGRAPNARVLWDALAQMYPDDAQVALERALSRPVPERVAALRAHALRFPQHAPSQMQLAIALVPSAFARIEPAAADDALRAADAAIRAKPDEAALLGVRGYVLERLQRHDEAMQHLDRATRIAPTDWMYEFKAEIAVREKKPALARAYLDSVLGLTQSLPVRVAARRNQAMLRVYEGSIDDAIAGMKTIAREAETDGLRGAAAATHVTIGLLYAAKNDAAGAEQAFAEVRRLNMPRAALAENTIIASALLGDGAKADSALATYRELAPELPADVREENVHRMEGLGALARGRYDEAIAHLKQGGPNPYSQLGVIEALARQRKHREAAAARAELMARKNVSLGSTAVAVAVHRSGAKKP